MPVRLNSTGGGSVTLDVPATSGTFTINLPAASGSVVTDAGAATVQFGAGSVSAPSITFSGDTNTGIYSPAADTIAFTEGGVEGMRLDASGNVGIGISSSGAKLHVFNAVNQTTNLQSGSGMNFLGLLSNTGGGNFGSQIRFVDGSIESATVSSIANGGLHFGTTGSERMRIDASGNVGIGTSSPSARLDVVSADSPELSIRSTQSGSWKSRIAFGNAARKWEIGSDISGVGNNNLYFYDAAVGVERVRIDNSGNFFVGRTQIGGFTNEVGLWFSPNQGISIGKNSSANMGACLYMNRMAAIGDGNLVEFAESGTLEGTISISGTTVSYNGGHLSRWSQLPTQQRNPALLKGTVLSNLDEMCEWLDAEGNPLPNEQLNRMKVSDVEGDPNVAGVFVNWDNDDQANPYDMNIAMTGDMIIRIAQGVVVQKGDLLMSAGDGTAKPQGDDIVRSKTVAKVTSNHVTCTYDDGSYCVPCVLMAC